MATKTLNHSPEFKQKNVASHRSGQRQNKLAREYGLARTTIRRWVAQIQPELPGFEGVAQPFSERAQKLQLLRENRQLREHHDNAAVRASRDTPQPDQAMEETVDDRRAAALPTRYGSGQ